MCVTLCSHPAFLLFLLFLWLCSQLVLLSEVMLYKSGGKDSAVQLKCSRRGCSLVSGTIRPLPTTPVDLGLFSLNAAVVPKRLLCPLTPSAPMTSVTLEGHCGFLNLSVHISAVLAQCWKPSLWTGLCENAKLFCF